MAQAQEARVPDIGDYRDVPVIEVLVSVGDTVKKDQGLITLESDKATLEVPAAFGGVVKELKVKVGDTLSAGDVVALIEPQGESQAAAAKAEVQRAREQQGGNEDENAQLLSAASNLEKAELDLSNTKVHARSAGLITDLRTDVGQFAAAGAPVMTLIAIHDVWISADMTENNLGSVQPGTPVSIILDAHPGRIFKGHVRSVGYGVDIGQTTQPGSLPTVENSRDWLRPAQRFPVIIEFEPGELTGPQGIRSGGQAEVMAFPSESNPLNILGRLFLRVMSWMSYAY